MLILFGCNYINIYACLFLSSSPFLFMIDDDRVTCHTGEYGVSGNFGNA